MGRGETDYRRNRSRSPRRRSPSRSPKRSRSHRSRSPRDYGSSRMPRGRYYDGRENPDPNPCLGVFGMSLHTTERDLKKIFGQFGEIESVQIVYDRFSGRSRGFGFVYFVKTRDATRAKENLRDAMIDGMKVRVDYSVTKTTSQIHSRDKSPLRRDRTRSPPRRSPKSSRSNTYSNSPPPARRRRSRSPQRRSRTLSQSRSPSREKSRSPSRSRSNSP